MFKGGNDLLIAFFGSKLSISFEQISLENTICNHENNCLYPQMILLLGWDGLFSHPSICPSMCPSMTFCFFPNILNPPGEILEISPWVKVFSINPEFRILWLTFRRKSVSKC